MAPIDSIVLAYIFSETNVVYRGSVLTCQCLTKCVTFSEIMGQEIKEIIVINDGRHFLLKDW